MLSALYSWAGRNVTAPVLKAPANEEDDVGVFPAPDSIQRARSGPTAAPSISVIEPEDDDADGDSDTPTLRGEEAHHSLAPEETKKKPKKSRKVALKPGRSQLDWSNLTRQGIDLREGRGEFMRITPSELAKHKTKDDAWMALNGKVYFITPYLEYHPGGEKELMRGVGRDGTKLFMNTHAWVNIDHMLQGCMIGMLVPENR
ncbi:cytochrome b5 [Atractiella rhizophila]|nr:cytochrome b5 [Atractiella rhizophila]